MLSSQVRLLFDVIIGVDVVTVAMQCLTLHPNLLYIKRKLASPRGSLFVLQGEPLISLENCTLKFQLSPVLVIQMSPYASGFNIRGINNSASTLLLYVYIFINVATLFFDMCYIRGLPRSIWFLYRTRDVEFQN